VKDLRLKISDLNKDEVLKTTHYMVEWMKRKAKYEREFSGNEVIPDEHAALDILGQISPEMANHLIEIFAEDGREGVARNFLFLLAEKEVYAHKVEEALDGPSLREPFTVSVATGILLLLFLEFDLEYVDMKAGKKLRISKKTPVLEMFAKILGL
jgi:hypothetical protein